MIKSTTQFIEKAKNVHGEKYDYSESEYIKSKSKITIKCRKHGFFLQSPNNHLKGAGCFKCGKESMSGKQRLSTQSFIESASTKHRGKYDYSLVEYTDSISPVKIICPIHGVFEQVPANHLRNGGCNKCGVMKTGEKNHVSNDEFIKKAKSVHGDRYDYSKTVYKGMGEPIEVKCKTHGLFEQKRAGDHVYKGAGCPACGVRFSAAEIELKEIIESLGFECVTSDRTLIKPLELDIVIPSLKIAIEYNGLIWHSEEYGKDKWYHHDKSKMCADKGYRLIHIWEDDWNRNKELQIEFLRHQLGKSRYIPIYARECVLTNVNKAEVKQFLDSYHIQGSTVFSESVCLTYEGELVSVTCFTRRDDKYELVRHCTSKPVIGSLGKAVKNFRKVCNTEIYTFLDKSRFAGDSYEKAGFVKSGEIPPDYMYFKSACRYHKFNFRRKQIAKLHPEVYSEDLSEAEMMEKAGYSRIWDCGKVRYVMP